MADFCRQCLLEIFGEDTEDLANITTSANEEHGFFAVVLCEGCGPIQVDRAGNCLSKDCEGDHRKLHLRFGETM